MTNVLKIKIFGLTRVKNGRIVSTKFNLENSEENDRLLSYLRPMVNDFVRRRFVSLTGDAELDFITEIDMRETKRGQTVEIEWVRTDDPNE
jgi:hypothetical protein